MSTEFNNYKLAVTSRLHSKLSPADKWHSIYDWYKGGGRQEFIDAFTKETGISFGRTLSPDDLVAMAIPKTYSDLDSKVADDAFYRAHSAWFLEEMDHIVSSVPRNVNSPSEEAGFAGVLGFTHHVLLDSVLLFDDWGNYRAGVPGVYGIGKNLSEHMTAFYQGARQTIYDHGSWGLSFADNHADTATATIRQAVEIRLRRAFGIMGKIRKSDDAIYPIALSDLIEAIDVNKSAVTFPVRFENIKRINGWSNMYLHSALKLYAWCPPRALLFLREFLLGKMSSSKAGVITDRVTFDLIRNIIEQKHTTSAFDVPLLDVSQCAIVIQ